MAECFPVKKCTTFGGQHGGNEDPADSGPKNCGNMPSGNMLESRLGIGIGIGIGIVMVVEMGKAEAPAKLGPAVG